MLDSATLGLRTDLLSLVGEKCWAVVAGTGTGSVLSLYFGGRVPRQRRLSNPNVSAEAQEFDGEYVLYIECAWRLDSEDAVICSWTDDNSRGETMLTGLQNLENETVRACELGHPAHDLTITFENGMALRIFCDQAGDDGPDNFSFFTGSQASVVGARGTVQRVRRIREGVVAKQ